MIMPARNTANNGNTAVETPATDRKPGAQPDNKNGLRHGLYCAPSPHVYINRKTCEFRRALEGAVSKAFGKISVRNAALINTAAAATTAAMANRKRRDQAGDKLTDELWLAFERAHLACLDLRDRKIAALNLPANGTADIFKALYAQQADNES